MAWMVGCRWRVVSSRMKLWTEMVQACFSLGSSAPAETTVIDLEAFLKISGHRSTEKGPPPSVG